MAYVPYIKVDDKMVAKLSFKHSACNYVYQTDSSGNQVGTLYETDRQVYHTIKDILTGDSDVTIEKDDKVFVLPGHPLAHNRIQDYLKSVGANTTKTLNAATVIAGCEDFFETMGTRGNQAKYASLLIEAYEIHKVVKNNDSLFNTSFQKLTYKSSVNDSLQRDFELGVNCVISSKAFLGISFDPNVDIIKDAYFMTPNCMEIIYHILSKGLKVLTEETVASAANSGLKLEDEEVYTSIYQMLDSTDRKNRSLGVDILVHCDLTGDTLYNLWRLATNFKRTIDSADKNKGLSYFKNSTNWYDLSNMSSSSFITYAEAKNKLTQRILTDLIPEVYESVVSRSPIDARPVYEWKEDIFFECLENGDYSYTVQLKEKWRVQLKQEEENVTTGLCTISSDK